jgi:hypothetical protein
MTSRIIAAAAVGTVLFGLAPGAVAEERLRPIEEFRSDLSAAERADADARQARAVASQAYLWGLPAFLHYRQTTEIKQARRAMAPGEEPFGGWVLLRQLATPDDRANVMPNVDTLYGAAYLLLDRQGPVVLSVPRVRGRYYSVALHDAYFNTFAVVGTRTNGGRRENVLIVPPDYRGRTPAGVSRVIRAPTPGIALFQRIFVAGEADIPAVRALQDQIRLAPLEGWRRGDLAFPRIETPEFDTVTPVRRLADPLAYFTLVNAHSCRNRPTGAYASLVEVMARTGLGPCADLPVDTSLRSAIHAGAEDARTLVDARVSAPRLRNGWVVPDPNTGRDSADYVGRAIVQITQIGSFAPEEAMYFVGRFDAEGAWLDGRNSYRLTFPKGQLPPVDPRAFWSLTMYDGETNLLVANPLRRHILRPSSPGLETSPDGSLTLHMSHRKPDGVPEGNWLPAPPGPFTVTLRTYLPSARIQHGDWFPAAIVRAN